MQELIPLSRKRDGCFVAAFIFILEVVDFICLFFEPIFKWLPILGLLYVLVPLLQPDCAR